MRIRAALLLVCFSLEAALTEPYRMALRGYRYQFPADHFNHPDFRTEWWYYTGNLRDASGRRFGFELTFFRHAVTPEHEKGIWDIRDVWLAHFAVSDIDGNRFYHTERLNRAGPKIAGVDSTARRIWNGNWSVHWTGDTQQLQAIADRFQIELTMTSAKQPVIHGADGISQKAPGLGRASHYISLTRLQVRGAVTAGGTSTDVTGTAWMDHEFFTHQLESGQTGWDWFSLQFNDNSELMLFRLRRKDGRADPFSAGTYIDSGGKTRHLGSTDFSLTPGRTWTSPETKGVYPVRWSIGVPSLNIEAEVAARLLQQELAGAKRAVGAYWEGAIEVAGTRQGSPLHGVGYLEMTGYAAPVRLGE